MKRTILFFFTLVIAAMGVEDVRDDIATVLQLTKEEIQMCHNMTEMSLEDALQFDAILTSNLPNKKFDESARRTGCFYACLMKKTNELTRGHINIQMLTKLMHNKNYERKIQLKMIQIYNTCAGQVNNKTDPCKISYYFLICVTKEMRLQNITKYTSKYPLKYTN